MCYPPLVNIKVILMSTLIPLKLFRGSTKQGLISSQLKHCCTIYGHCLYCKDEIHLIWLFSPEGICGKKRNYISIQENQTNKYILVIRRQLIVPTFALSLPCNFLSCEGVCYLSQPANWSNRLVNIACKITNYFLRSKHYYVGYYKSTNRHKIAPIFAILFQKYKL